MNACRNGSSLFSVIEKKKKKKGDALAIPPSNSAKQFIIAATQAVNGVKVADGDGELKANTSCNHETKSKSNQSA